MLEDSDDGTGGGLSSPIVVSAPKPLGNERLGLELATRESE